jgi:hypothetical protein
MSRLAFSSPSPSPVTVTTPQKIEKHHIIIEATVKPLSTNDFNKDRVSVQASTLRELRKTGKDVFELNETRKVQSSGTYLYQTTETYGTAITIERVVEFLDRADLTLRVNFNRPGTHSSTTCMELSSTTLKALVNTSPDTNGYKIAELRVKAEKSANVPPHGSIFIAITKKGTQHYISHVDYKIMVSYDKMYHSSS